MKIFIQRLHDWTGSQKNRNILIQFFFLIFVILTAYYLVTKALLLDITLKISVLSFFFGFSFNIVEIRPSLMVKSFTDSLFGS